MKKRPYFSTASKTMGLVATSMILYEMIHNNDDERNKVNDKHTEMTNSFFIEVPICIYQRFEKFISRDKQFFNYRPRQVPCTFCETEQSSHEKHSTEVSSDKEINDSFPNLSRHGKNSMLRKILTESLYNELRTRITSKGITVEDIIRAGVALPYGANPPHGVAGVYAGDAESYTIFAPLFDPIIELHHKATSRVRLQRFRTNLNPGGLIEHRLDPTGEYILYTRMRLARSIIGFRFTPCMTRNERRTVERLVRDCVADLEQQQQNHDEDQKDNKANGNPPLKGGYISVIDMSNKQHDDLVRRQLLFTDPDEYLISAGFARDWPDGRGIYCDTWVGTPNLMIWCNAADHIWIISNAKGGDVQSVFKRMSKAVWALETSLKQHGHGFVEDHRLGFLNASPGDIGTALRASVYIKLVRLGQHKGFHALMKRLHLEARAEQYSQATTDTIRYTGIFDIGNAEALGKTEVQLINIMIHGVAICIDLERRLQNGEVLDLDKVEIPHLLDSSPLFDFRSDRQDPKHFAN
jgi:creatine kinase